MHVLIAHNEYGKPSGEEQALASIEALLTAEGHRVSRFRRSSAEIGDSPLRMLKAAATGIDNPFERRRMDRTLADLVPDLVLAQNLYPFLSPGILQACRTRRVPVVMRCCNYRLFCPSGLHLSGNAVCERCLGPGREWWCVLKNCEGNLFKSAGYALRNATARAGGRVLNAVDVFVVLTEFQKRRFVANGIPEARIAVIGNHTEAPPLRPGIGGLVTFIGRVAPEKGIADFLALARRLPDVPFAVAGAVKPSAAPLLEHLPPNVALRGHLDRTELGALLADSRVVMACSRWYEGFPNAVLDAMAAARPVLAANIGALPEIVEDGRTGLLFRAGDLDDAAHKLRRLVASPRQCEALGAAGHARVRNVYGPARAYAAYMDAFQRARAVAGETREEAPAWGEEPVHSEPVA